MTTTSASGYLSPSAHHLRNHACVIPCGGLTDEAPLHWKAEQLQYYAAYLLNGKPIDRMFESFIFNGIRTRDSHYLFPLYVGFGEPAEKNDWQQWIDALFFKHSNLHALNQLANGKTFDVWISVPYPHPLQRNFGKINGSNLDFQLENDRQEAVRWWLDECIQRWNKEARRLTGLTLKGFLWQREAIDASDEALAAGVNQTIREKGLLSLWLPNYGSYGVMKWKELGFDVTAINSNYYGNTSFDWQWINHASLFAKTFHTGLQIIFGKGLIYNETHHLDYWNLGLNNKNAYMTESFLVYHFPNQSLGDIYDHRLVEYIRLYTFIKGLYQKISYPGISY